MSKAACPTLLLTGVSAMALVTAALTPAAAVAQTADRVPPAAGSEAPDASVDSSAAEEIVVTGLRQSLQSAQNIKRNSEQFVDSVTAQDIGRLPDVNIAEALQRVSGVQITRNRGEGSGIAVRGLTQVRTELNGRDIFQASGGRGLSWEEVGADLLAGVDIYKNPSAELIEGGLSGTINLRTRMPFDSAGQVIAATAASTYFDLIERGGQQVSGLYSNRWQTGIGEIGFLANLSWQTTAFREDKVVVEPFYLHGPNPTGRPGIEPALPGFSDRDVLAPHGGGFSVAYGDRERVSGAAALQWKPSDRLEFYAQYFRADYKISDSGVSFFAYGQDMPASTVAGRPFTVDADGIARTGYFSNPNVDSVSFNTIRDTSTWEAAGGFKWQITDRLRLGVDYQHIDSTVDQQTMNLTASALNPRISGPGRGENWDLFFDITGDIPVLQSTNPGYFSRLSNYGMTAILPYAEQNDATSDAIRGDLSWDFEEGGFLRSVSAGVRYSDKSAINRNTTYGTWTAIGQTCQSWSGSCFTLDQFPQYAEQNRFQPDLIRGRARDRAFGPVFQFADALTANAQAAFDAIRSVTGQEIGFRPFDDPGAFLGTIDEKSYAAYMRVAFGADLGGTMRFDGNVGLRAVRTESAGVGTRNLTYRDPNATPGTNPDGTPTAPPNIEVSEPFVGGRDYDKYLPSLNLRLLFTERLQARFAASRNFSRPSFTQLNPSFNIQPSYTAQPGGQNLSAVPDRLNNALPYDPVSNPYVGTGTALGNPNLLPEEVTQFDAALEWYFDNVGYAYVTFFHKDIKNLLDQRPTVPLRQEIDGLGVVQFNTQGFVNVPDAYVRGFEVGGQKFFDFLPAPFDGLGIQANYTYADSSAGAQAAGDINSTTVIDVPLRELSKHSFNLIGLYDRGGLNLRVAYNWRGEYLQGTANTGTQNLPIFGDSFGVLDASITYDVTPNFAITLDAQNLLDTAFRTYQVFDNRPRDYVINDRRFSVRARVRL